LSKRILKSQYFGLFQNNYAPLEKPFIPCRLNRFWRPLAEEISAKEIPVVWAVPPRRGGTAHTTQVISLLEISLILCLLSVADLSFVQSVASSFAIADSMISIPHPFTEIEAKHYLTRRLEE
jgi:hypothetical protein